MKEGGGTQSRWSKAKSTFLKIDIFKERVPSLTYQGKEKQPTVLGTIVTILLFVTMISYASLKFGELYNRRNPSITSNDEPNALQDSDRLNLKSAGLYVAFNAEDFGRKALHDPRYTKWVVNLYGYSGGEVYERALDHHECTPEDLEKFAPPTREAATVLEATMQSDESSLMCLDWDKDGDNIEIWGAESGYEYQRLEFIFVPCNFIHDGKDGATYNKSECIANETAQRDYLKSYYINMYISDNTFRQDSFGDESIESRSRFH